MAPKVLAGIVVFRNNSVCHQAAFFSGQYS
jgi:hypothetical protein